MADYSSYYDDPLHDERQEQRSLRDEQRRPVRISGQRYDPDDVPTRGEVQADERESARSG